MRKTRTGVTLIEVTIAVAILGAALTILLAGASRCLAVMKASRNYQEAQWTFGRGELDFPLIVSNDIEELEVDPEEYDNGFTFWREVEEKDDEEENEGLYVVTSKIRWTSRGRDAIEEIVQYVFFPLQEP